MTQKGPKGDCINEEKDEGFKKRVAKKVDKHKRKNVKEADKHQRKKKEDVEVVTLERMLVLANGSQLPVLGTSGRRFFSKRY